MGVEELVKNKELLLVGNGSEVLGKGELIDSYECVVRFNFGIRQNKGFKVGSKCDLWVYAMSSEGICLDTYNRATIKPFYCVRFANPCKTKIGDNFIDMSKERLDVFYKLSKLFELASDENPSTGVSLLYYIVNYCSPKSITLIGFDSFKTPNFYANRVWANLWHDSSKEEAYIKKLEEEGKIRVL